MPSPEMDGSFPLFQRFPWVSDSLPFLYSPSQPSRQKLSIQVLLSEFVVQRGYRMCLASLVDAE